jgi:hypothetical protein
MGVSFVYMRQMSLKKWKKLYRKAPDGNWYLRKIKC